MEMKKKPTYEQALGLQKGQAAARAAQRRRAAETPTQTPEEKAEWNRRKEEALTAYRAKKAEAAENDLPRTSTEVSEDGRADD
jgi:hypothetical protein